MTVYADILIILELAVNYFLLALTAALLRLESSIPRQLAAALVGALSSLTIFLPEFSEPLLVAIQLLVALIMACVAFSARRLKRVLRNTAVLFAVSCGYAGGMMAIWTLLHPSGMVVHNSVVYFNISPLFLVLFSTGAYFAVMLFRYILGRNASLAERCTVKLFAQQSSIELEAIADTGNSLEDVFGLSEIIIADRAAAYALLGDLDSNDELKKRYRALPCSTVSGDGMLDGYRCDKAYIEYNGKTLELRRPILAVSKQSLGQDYSAIVNPKILS